MKSTDLGVRPLGDSFVEFLDEQTVPLNEPLKSRRGRPSKSEIQAIITASRGGLSNSRQGKSVAAPESHIQIGSALGVGSVLNPELNVRFQSILVKSQQVDRHPVKTATHPRYLDIFEQLIEAGALAEESHSDYFALLDQFVLREAGFGIDSFKAFLQRCPGHDAYFMAGRVEQESIYPNLWVAYSHQRASFADFAARCAAAVSWPLERLQAPMESRWIGGFGVLIAKPKYWRQLADYILNFIAECERVMGKDVFREDLVNHGDELAVCLIAEFRKQANQFSHMKIRSRRMEAGLGVYENDLRELKDLAALHQNPWLASVWSNYAALYLQSKDAQVLIDQIKPLRPWA